MNKIKTLFAVLILVIAPVMVFAQDIGVEMADKLRSNGKIYVVVASVLVIFTGILIFMVVTDRKLARLERIQKAGGKHDA
jgi:hypothetical protein